MEQLEQDVRRFITENFVLVADGASVAGDASLTRGGIVDSVGIVELIHFVETRFGIEIADEELIPENIDTIDNIVRYVRAKRGLSRHDASAVRDDARV
jgi:acyl carrier protein